jgi:hypothetical protein
MGKALTAVGAAFVVCFGVLGLLVFLNRTEDRVAVDNLLAERLTRAITIAGDQGGEVDLAAIADFGWDRVLIVPRGTPSETISGALGTEFRGDLNYDAESEHIFVFADGKALAKFADYRGRAAFEGFDEPVHEMARGDAVLRVDGNVVRPGG